MEKAKIYRIENEETMHGMWYRADGVYEPFINRLTDGKSKDLPMGFHERYHKENLNWYSGCTDINLMRSWFSDSDAFELYSNGYRLFEFQSKQFAAEDYQTLFTREGILTKEEIPLETIWNINNFSRESIVLK